MYMNASSEVFLSTEYFCEMSLTWVSFKLCEFILHQVPSYSPASIAEYAIAQIMALAKNTHMSYVMTKKANFEVTSMQAIAVKSSKQGNCL